MLRHQPVSDRCRVPVRRVLSAPTAPIIGRSSTAGAMGSCTTYSRCPTQLSGDEATRRRGCRMHPPKHHCYGTRSRLIYQSTLATTLPAFCAQTIESSCAAVACRFCGSHDAVPSSTGAARLRVPTGGYDASRVAGVVDALLFLGEVPGPVGVDVAVADQRPEFEDRLRPVESRVPANGQPTSRMANCWPWVCCEPPCPRTSSTPSTGAVPIIPRSPPAVRRGVLPVVR